MWSFSVFKCYVKFYFFYICVFNIFLICNLRYRYCRMLEEGFFRGRIVDFVFMFFFGGFLMIVFFNK